MSNSYAVVLSGGSGTRLWPLSRSLKPKQLLPLNGDETLLQQTARRLMGRVPPERLFVVTNEEHKFEVKGQLSEVAPALVAGVMTEPVGRNTLPAIALAVYSIARHDPDAVVGVFPSDHAIGNEAAFLDAWVSAEQAAKDGYLCLIGVQPTGPSTGYGYIESGQSLSRLDTAEIRKVLRFVEKPDAETAAEFVSKGYLWNGGMFIFRASTFMELLEQYQPAIHQAFFSTRSLDEFYQELPNISMDYGLSEKAANVAVVPADMAWSDLGNWDSIYSHHSKDPDQNLCRGDVVTADTQGSLLWSTQGLLATLGLKNIAVIQTPDATLVCDRARTEEIKELVAKLQTSHLQLTKIHSTVYRPWGTYTVLEEGSNFKIKRIVINPNGRLSMQLHHHRSEHWVVVSGTAKITNGEQEFLLQENQSAYIPQGQKHRLENPGEEPLHIIEVQCGDYVGEDDIVRFDDIYGRVEKFNE